MRTIRFRGKRTEDGRWVYGCLLFACGRAFIADILVERKNGGARLMDGRYYEVDPETVGQFVAEDMHGTDIYEDDLVKIDGELCRVKYSSEEAQYKVETTTKGCFWDFGEVDMEVVETGSGREAWHEIHA